jgi:signal peptidase I
VGLILASWSAAILYMYSNNRIVGFALLAVPFAGVALIALDAVLCARRAPADYGLKWYNRPGVYAAVFLSLLLTVNPLMDLLVGRHIVRAFFMTNGSMAPAVLDRDLVVVNKLAQPRRGDIVLIELGESGAREGLTEIIDEQFLRRLIAIPGDVVEIRGRQVYLNGGMLDEPYASYRETATRNIFTAADFRWGPDTVPEGSVFVLADAREYVLDSRILGFVDRADLSGVATKIFWSWNLEEGDFLWERTTMALR